MNSDLGFMGIYVLPLQQTLLLQYLLGKGLTAFFGIFPGFTVLYLWK